MDSSVLAVAASKTNVTVPIIFQAAFQLWLAKQSAAKHKSQVNGTTVSFDYLHTGRNIDLPQPDTINGPCATFVPLFVPLENETESLSEYVSSTQSSFWEATENATLSIKDIYESAGLDRKHDRNEVLFLYQPFEPPLAQVQSQPTARFVAMAGSQIRMLQPYAMVCQVKKTASNHLVQFTYDEHVFSKGQIREGIEGVWEIVAKMCDGLLKKEATVGSIL